MLPSPTLSIELRQLLVGYDRSVVAGPLTAQLKAGTLTCLLGRNGTGKSTLLRTLAGLQPALGGSFVAIGETVEPAAPPHPVETSTAPPHPTEEHPVAQGQVGIVLTRRMEGLRLTGREMVALGRMPYTGFLGRLNSEDRQVVQWALEETQALALAERQVQTLSDGEWQRIMLARVLAQQTPVVLADEVTAFLDYPSKRAVMRLLKEVAHRLGLAVLLSTHDVPLALEEADRLWLLTSDGSGITGQRESCLLEGSPVTLSAQVQKAFAAQ